MSGTTVGGVRIALRLEGLRVLVAAVACYAQYGAGWGDFAACFLISHLSFAGYLAGGRVGAATYSVAHSYVGPRWLPGCRRIDPFASCPSSETRRVFA